MIEHDKTSELQAIAWICEKRDFVYISQDFFSGKEKEYYITLKNQYDQFGEFDLSELHAKYYEVMVELENVALPGKFETIQKKLEDNYKARNLLSTINHAYHLLNNAPDNYVDICAKMVDDVCRLQIGQNAKTYTHAESIKKYFFEYIEAGYKMDGALKGVSVGLPELDKVIRGWQRGKTYAIGGLKKTGKSRFALHLVSEFLKQKLKGLLFSMEMLENDIHTCILANRTGINTALFGTNTLTRNNLNAIGEAVGQYAQESLYIETKSSVTIHDVRNGIQRVRNKLGGIDFVVVDYIQRMKGHGETRAKEVEHLATSLADISRDENIIMIILSQLSGEAEKNNTAPPYAFFKESQSIIEACDCALVLTNPNRGKENKGDKTIICTVLQRDGVSDVNVKLHAELEYSRFSCEEEYEYSQPVQEHWAM